MPQLEAGPRQLRRNADDREPARYQHVTLAPFSPTIGAEVLDIDLTAAIDDDVLDELHRALLEWKVLFFRNQHLTSAQHRDFAARWGQLEVHPFLPTGDVPEIVRFAKDDATKGYENVWHSDVSWREIPSMGSILRAIEVPPIGGDTLWADMGAAYDGLTDETKARIDGLSAVHDFSQTFGLMLDADGLARMQAEYPPVEHPVVRIHPETGRRTLYVSAPFTSHVVGLDPSESEALLDLLCRQASVPEYQCRFRWEEGSIAFWDNRATQHYAVSDYWPQPRVMERATVIGDRPFGAWEQGRHPA